MRRIAQIAGIDLDAYEISVEAHTLAGTKYPFIEAALAYERPTPSWTGRSLAYEPGDRTLEADPSRTLVVYSMSGPRIELWNYNPEEA